MIRGLIDWHPLIAAMYFAGLFILLMTTSHPFYLLMIGCAVFTLLYLHDRSRLFLSSIKGYLFIVLFVMLMNPLFSSRGATILGYLFGRAITLESVLYGLLFGWKLFLLFFVVQAYERVIEMDRFLYLMGSVLPRTSLVLVMTMRLIPLMKCRLVEIRDIAKVQLPDTGIEKRQLVKGAMEQMHTLVEWSLESALQTAVSMRARGFGYGKRTSARVYRMETGDRILGLFFLVAGALVLRGFSLGIGNVVFYPRFEWGTLDVRYLGLFLVWILLPIIAEGGERLLWRSMKLRI